MIGWLEECTPEEVLPFWPDAPVDDPEVLRAMLTTARIECEAWAPDLGASVEVPHHYWHAQALQARDRYRAGMAGNDGQIGVDGQFIATFPLSWTVKQILRPRRMPRPR